MAKPTCLVVASTPQHLYSIITLIWLCMQSNSNLMKWLKTLPCCCQVQGTIFSTMYVQSAPHSPLLDLSMVLVLLQYQLQTRTDHLPYD